MPTCPFFFSRKTKISRQEQISFSLLILLMETRSIRSKIKNDKKNKIIIKIGTGLIQSFLKRMLCIMNFTTCGCYKYRWNTVFSKAWMVFEEIWSWNKWGNEITLIFYLKKKIIYQYFPWRHFHEEHARKQLHYNKSVSMKPWKR